MANASIYAAFERMWQHVTAALGNKSDKGHNHNDIYYTQLEIDAKLESTASNFNIVLSQTGEIFSADKTYEEIIEAFNQGKTLYMVYDCYNITYRCPLSCTYEGKYIFEFSVYGTGGSNEALMEHRIFMVDSENNWTATRYLFNGGQLLN